jgi:hypothetical protein
MNCKIQKQGSKKGIGEEQPCFSVQLAKSEARNNRDASATTATTAATTARATTAANANANANAQCRRNGSIAHATSESEPRSESTSTPQ